MKNEHKKIAAMIKEIREDKQVFVKDNTGYTSDDFCKALVIGGVNLPDGLYVFGHGRGAGMLPVVDEKFMASRERWHEKGDTLMETDFCKFTMKSPENVVQSCYFSNLIRTPEFPPFDYPAIFSVIKHADAISEIWLTGNDGLVTAFYGTAGPVNFTLFFASIMAVESENGADYTDLFHYATLKKEV